MKKTYQALTIMGIACAVFFGLLAWRTLIGNPQMPGIYSYVHLSGFSLSLSLRLILIAVSSATVGLVYRLLALKGSPRYQWFAGLIFIIAPSTIVLSALFSPYGVALLLIALSLNLVHTRLKSIALLPLIGMLWIDWVSLICSMIITGSYMLYVEKKCLLRTAPVFAGLAIAGIIKNLPYALEHAPKSLFLKEIFSDLGGLYGLGLFMSILAVIGIILSWPYKKKLVGAYASILAIVIMSIWSTIGLLYLSPIVTLFAAYALVYFWEREWNLPFIRFLTLAVIIYGILFSGIAVMNTIAEMPPSTEVIESVQWLKNHPFYSDDIVLSHPEKGFWIGYGATSFITYHDPAYNKKLNITQEIFASRDFKKTIQLLESNNISIIWIDSEMKNGQVWTSENEGLLYLFTDPRFLKVYDTNDIEIWRLK
ncbi:MAG TPA: hypothetical protein VJB66_02410 [Candidatus Nanoarchaeia archaeon]|nr:hypothetical protein [Candidatus Nanoarchaeia archaeon]